MIRELSSIHCYKLLEEIVTLLHCYIVSTPLDGAYIVTLLNTCRTFITLLRVPLGGLFSLGEYEE